MKRFEQLSINPNMAEITDQWNVPLESHLMDQSVYWVYVHKHLEGFARAWWLKIHHPKAHCRVGDHTMKAVSFRSHATLETTPPKGFFSLSVINFLNQDKACESLNFQNFLCFINFISFLSPMSLPLSRRAYFHSEKIATQLANCNFENILMFLK